MNEPWVFESGKIDFSGDVETFLLRNESIDRYLSTSLHDKYLYLVGPKGIGKTFLLNYKSFLFRKHFQDSLKFAPATQLSESLTSLFTQFSKEEIAQYQSLDIWVNIWKYVLFGLSSQTYGINVSERLKTKDVNFSSATSILTSLLSNRKGLHRQIGFALPILMNCAMEIQSGTIIFIDGIDGAVETFTDKTFYDFHTYQNTSLQVWSNIHVGIAKAIYDIMKLNTHVKIYTTLRSEAFKLIPGGIGLNLEGYAIHLNYTPNELKKIFINNIKLIDKRKLIAPNAASEIERFIGYETMPHPFVHNQTESVLDFLIRHTLGRPREMVLFGSKIFLEKVTKEEYKIADVNEKTEIIRFFINEISEDILENYMQEIIGSFDKEDLIKFLKKIQFNVFNFEILSDNEKQFLSKCYNIGLIGIITERVNGNKDVIKLQHFKKAGDYNYANVNTCPKSDFYVTHPILDCFFIKLFNLEFYNRTNIVGNENKFVVPNYLYDYAISYSGRDQLFVDSIASELKQADVKIFYDKDYEHEYLGNDLVDYLSKVYKSAAKNVIIIFSHQYLDSKWTKFEYDAIINRLLNDYTSSFIKIVKIDDVIIPELLENRAYINASQKSAQDIAKLLLGFAK